MFPRGTEISSLGGHENVSEKKMENEMIHWSEEEIVRVAKVSGIEDAEERANDDMYGLVMDTIDARIENIRKENMRGI